MKVLLLNIDRFYDAKGGTEKVLCDMANALKEKGYEIEILICDDKSGDIPFPLRNDITITNIGCSFNKKLNLFERLKRLFIKTKRDRHIYDSNILDPKYAKRIMPALKNSKPDVIISYQLEGTRILMNYIRPDIPIITMLHFNPNYKLGKCSDNTLKALSQSTYVQVLLNSYIDITQKYIKTDNIVCIPNAVPQFEYIQETKNKTIIHVGRFSKIHKRQHLLIEAFNKIAHQYPEWTVEFWGEVNTDPKYYVFCNSMVQKYHLTDRIKFCGTTNNISEKLSKAELFVFPSAHEGFGLSLAEAMGHGLPSIGFKNCPAVNELIIDRHNGILCDDGVASLAQAMSELMSNSTLRKVYGINAKENIKKYEPENIWNKWNDLIVKSVSENKK